MNKRSEAWNQLRVFVEEARHKRAFDIDLKTERLFEQLTPKERCEYRDFALYHTNRTNSNNGICSRCSKVMAQRDIKWHRACVRSALFASFPHYDYLDRAILNCRKTTIYSILVLRHVGICKDISQYIGRIVYSSRWDMLMWVQTNVHRRKKWKNKRKEPMKELLKKMNSQECLLQILVKRRGIDQIIADQPIDEVTEARRELYFAQITSRFLVHVLSYTYLNDTKSVMLTCKEWYRATQDSSFWKRRIEHVKQTYHDGIKDFFDPFGERMMCISLEQRLKWLFKKGTWLYRVDDTIWKCKSTGNLWVRQYTNNTIEYISNGGVIGSATGRYIHVTYNTRNYTKSLVDFKAFTDTTGTGSFWFKNGTFYSGQCLDIVDNQIVPHGDGKWIFVDGSELEGECVAYKGKPRYLEPPTKRMKKEPYSQSE